jgi:hypothetical protein
VSAPASLTYQVMTEKELDRHIRQLCKDLHLRRYHTLDARGSSAGFPDLCIVGPGGVIFAELKSARGTLRPEQAEWRDLMLDAGARWYLWRPADLASGEITRALAGISTYRNRKTSTEETAP